MDDTGNEAALFHNVLSQWVWTAREKRWTWLSLSSSALPQAGEERLIGPDRSTPQMIKRGVKVIVLGVVLFAIFTGFFDGKAEAAPPVCLQRSEPGTFTLRLDNARHAYLFQRHEESGIALYAGAYAEGDQKCATLIDSIRSTEPSTTFQFECRIVGHSAPVVALTRIDEIGTPKKIVRAWLIDPASLRFVPADRRVRCVPFDYAGDDDGSDLLSRARERKSSGR